MTPRTGRTVMLVTAGLAMGWAIARAAVQSISIDEAVTYLAFVSRGLEWYPGTNNHLLNSLLMRVFTLWFGPSHLSVRAPALLGAGIYIAAAYRLCRLFAASAGGSIAVAWPLLVCLVYNPFVFDYLVAARGYGMALGFLMWAIVAAAEAHWPVERRTRSLTTACAVSSVCVGLSFAANLAFAFVDFFTISAVFLLAWRRGNGLGKSLAAGSIPALIVTALLPATILLHWPKGELWFGSNSLAEMFSTLTAASLYRVNPALPSPLLHKVIGAIKDYLWPALFVTAGACAADYYWRQRRPSATNPSGGLALALTAILTATLTVHWLCFRTFHLLLPKERTGIYVVPLALTIAGAIASLPTRTLRKGLISVLFVMAGYFLLCLRLQYFKEWQWDADVKDVYPVLACLNKDRGIQDVATHWMYSAPLNFYRVQSGHESLAPFESEVGYRPEQRVLVLNAFLEKPTIDARGLKVIYKGKSTDVLIAATPDIEASLRSSVCIAQLRP